MAEEDGMNSTSRLMTVAPATPAIAPGSSLADSTADVAEWTSPECDVRVRRGRRTRDGGTSPAHAGSAARRLSLLASFAAIVAVFFVFVRPWYQQWGATAEEARRPLPGDEIVPNAAAQETRAITIDANLERVWPWLAQLGQDRGGFYSYDLLENLVGCRMPTEDRLRPDRQSWQVGDKLWMYPPNRAGGAGFATLHDYVPGRALGFGTRAIGTPLDAPEDGSWSFVLEPLGDSLTRLLVRGRVAAGRSLLGVVVDRSIFEPMHFVMERRTMIGLRQLAEGGDRGRLVNHLQVALWTITLGLLVTTVVMAMRRRYWLRPLAGFVAAAAVFQILTLGQPPVAVAGLLVAAVGGVVWWPARSDARLWRFDPGTRAILVRALGVWLVILLLAVMNGTLRNTFVSPRVGDQAAHIIATVVLSALVVGLVWRTIRWIGPASRGDALRIGAMWVALTLAFEFLAGHYLFGAPWERLLADYDVVRGRIWPLILLTTFVAPVWAHRRERAASAGASSQTPRGDMPGQPRVDIPTPTLHVESRGLIRALPDRVFAHVDDHARLSAHMKQRSWKMGGGHMDVALDEQRGQSVGSRIRIAGRVFGVRLWVDEIITERLPPERKVWETVGSPRLLVIGSYRMGFEVIPAGDQSELRVFIDYALPAAGLAQVLGVVFGRAYARRCTRRMVVDAATHFASTPDAVSRDISARALGASR
jgi:hypothetical protein